MVDSALNQSGMTAEQRNVPTILLVQGSFQIPRVYEQLVKGLVAQGLPTLHPKLPSCSDIE